jgi:hypothetical protein
MASKHISSKKPWNIALIFVRPPAFTLADERTITAVIGKPPNIPLTTLPAPWATSSRFVGDIRLIGSILSTASRLSKVSKLATMAMVAAVIQTSLLPIPLKFGDLNRPKNSPVLFTKGICTIVYLTKQGPCPKTQLPISHPQQQPLKAQAQWPAF